MEQIIQTVQLSKYNTSGSENKSILLDKKYTLDNPIFENAGKLNIPKGSNCEFHQLNDVNYIYLYSDCPFNLLINNLVIINTTQFSFVNTNKTISVAIETNVKYDLTIDFVYGTLKAGQQDVAAKQIQNTNKSSAKWDRVLKNIILETKPEDVVDDYKYTNSNSNNINNNITCENFDATVEQCNTCKHYFDNIPNFADTNSMPCYKNRYNAGCCYTPTAVQKVKDMTETSTEDGRVRYITRKAH